MKRALGFLILIGLLLALSFPTTVAAQEAPKPEPLGLTYNAPTYALHGPYWVGTRDYLVPESDGQFGVSVWYPALNPEGKSEVITYQVSQEFKAQMGIPDDMEMPIIGHALADAAPDVENGPYPLVVFSNGLAMMRQSSSYLFEHLASMGFVVMAMEHRGENFTEYWQGAYYRPMETLAAIQYADQLTADGGDLAGVINVDKLAVMGASSGGWTALVGGGAQMNLGGCPANPGEPQGLVWFSDCLAFLPHQAEIAAALGLDGAPDGSWPQQYDSRVDAVITNAPDGDIWGAEYQGVASVTVPTMVIASSKDSVNIPDRASYPIYEHLGSTVKSMVVFENADHPIIVDKCAEMSWMADQFQNSWVCSDPVWDEDRAHDLIDHFTTAFLLDVLKGDADAHAALAPDAVSFNGIEYQAQGF